MLDPQTLDLTSLPSVPLSDRRSLPETPAIYFAVDSQGAVQYIGRSLNPRQRWVNHHRYPQLSATDGVRIAYLDCPAELLNEVEAALIDWFDPPLNGLVAQQKRQQRKVTGSVKNKIKQFLDARGITRYQFRQDTGIAQRTAYDLYAKPDQIPSSTVLEKICDAYQIQPGELLEWVPKTNEGGKGGKDAIAPKNLKPSLTLG